MNPDQSIFRAALLDPAHPVPGGLSDGQNRAAGRRFSVYRNNIATSLIQALQAGFPVVLKLLGQANFDVIAGCYLRKHPPESPVMMHYGQGFPTFLAGFEQVQHLGYLPDMARLELALRRSFHAADVTVINPDELQTLPMEHLMQARVTFVPALELIGSDWPIFDIWRFNTVTGAPKPTALAQDVLVTRPEFDPAPHLLPKGGAVWINALKQRQTFGAAYDAGLKTHAEFDLGATLALLIAGAAISEIQPKDNL